MRRPGLPAFVGLALLAGACSGSPSGTLQLVTGDEKDTFTLAPAPVVLKIQSVDASGKATTLATHPLPTSNIDVGQQSEATVASFQAIGYADTSQKERVVFGASLPVIWGALDGTTLQLFVQRVGAFARLPNPLGDARPAPLLADVQGEYIFVGGGTQSSLATSTQIYDFLPLAPLTGTGTLPLAPASAAFVGTVGWFFASGGTAQYYDLSSDTAATIPPLSGGAFADIAGGYTVIGDSGIQYIVGATRAAGAPTGAILEIDPGDASDTNYQVAGRPKWLSLKYPRLGASATWVEGRGLVVAGGSATAPGIEVLAAGATTGAPLAYPPDDTVSAGATALSSQLLLLAGGVSTQSGAQGGRTIDLACAATCAAAAWQPPPPVPLADAQAFALSQTEALVVGNASTGATHVYRMTSSSTTEVATKVPHTNARAIVTPVGSIGIVGGSPQIETFVL